MLAKYTFTFASYTSKLISIFIIYGTYFTEKISNTCFSITYPSKKFYKIVQLIIIVGIWK